MISQQDIDAAIYLLPPPASPHPQHSLYFFQLPQGQGSLRSILGPAWNVRTEAGGTVGDVRSNWSLTFLTGKNIVSS